MALKAMMLRRSIDRKRTELDALREKDAEFSTREAELETAISEAETDEQQQAVTEEVEKYEAEKKEHEDAKNALSSEIDGLEAELAELEKDDPKRSSPPQGTRSKERMEVHHMMTATTDIRSLPMGRRAFDALSMERRQEIVQQQDVKEFLARLRSFKGQTREISGAELTIPVVFLDLISENMYRYSKLLNRVRVRNVRGEARQTIAGTVPEAIWTEMCGAINELTFAFNQIVLDGYKVAGYIPICNSMLEDSDIDLAGAIVEMLSEGRGLAMDKAILYGKGAASHMPLGIVTRLAQSSAPEGYPANAPAWVDLSDSNIITINGTTGTIQEFWTAFMAAAANTTTLYSRGRMFWAMNSRTYWTLRSKLIQFNYEGYPVTNLPSVMPFVDGDVDILEFIPDGDIIGGYGDLYLLALRSGMVIESSREVQFIQDNTVFRGKQRADGMPVVPGAFVAININNTAPTTVMDFPADTANDAQLTALSVGTESLSPTFSATTYSYTIAAAANASDKIEATATQAGAKIAIAYNGANVRNGGTVTWTADSKAYPLTITVTQGNKTRVYTVNVTKAAGG